MLDGDSTRSQDASTSALFDRPIYASGDVGMDYSAHIPESWTSRQNDPWTHVDPIDANLPDQGWKIHISATLQTAPQILSIAARVFTRNSVSFKFLTHEGTFTYANSKYMDRASAGKFITAYPKDVRDLQLTLEQLDDNLKWFNGPYILSDARVGSGPVYVRYGAFKGIHGAKRSGEPSFFLRGPAGSLVEDVRLPDLSVPPFVEVPNFLRRAIDDRQNPQDSTLDTLLEGYELVRPLHFSNAGGVFLLKSNATGEHVVMKEGRRYAGILHDGSDAYSRVQSEAATIAALAPTECTPQLIKVVVFDESAYVFESWVEGELLFTWVATNYPYYFNIDTRGYAARASRVLFNIMEAVQRLHDEGFYVLDLQPSNVLVNDNLNVTLIDLESCASTGSTDVSMRIGTPGYVPQGSHTGSQRDAFAMWHIALHMYYPISPLPALSESISEYCAARAEETFGKAEATTLAALRACFKATGALGWKGDSLQIADTDALDLSDTHSRLKAGLHNLRNWSLEGQGVTRRLPYQLRHSELDPALSVSIENGLSGIIIALGKDDENAEEDLEALDVMTTKSPARADSRLLSGILGVALTLSIRGKSESARRLYWEQCCGSIIADDNISLRSGLAGRYLGQMMLGNSSGDAGIIDEASATLAKLVRLIEFPPAHIVSPGSMLTSTAGILDGWSSVSLALTVAAEISGNQGFYSHARDALQCDLARLKIVDDYSAQVDDGFRVMPYLADGSAGVGVALSAIPLRHRRDGDSTLLQQIVRACRPRVCASSDLYHGRSGLILALASLDVDEIDGLPIQDVLQEQVNLLSPYLLRGSTSDAEYLPSGSNMQLSPAMSEGAAGLLFTLALLKESPLPHRRGSLLARVATRGSNLMSHLPHAVV